MDTISIIIPVHKNDIGLEKCMESLALLDPPPIEILVVLDGITNDKVVGIIPQNFQIVENQASSGPSVARNLGAKSANGDILCFIDSDVSVPKNLINSLLKEYANGPSLAAVFGSYDDSPGHKNFLSQYKNLFHHFVHQRSLEDASTFWSGCGAIRRSVFDKLDGFDEKVLWLEDVEFGLRLKASGHKVKLAKSIQVKHWKRWDTKSLLLSDIFHRAIPWTKFALRYGKLPNDLNTISTARLSSLLIFFSIFLLMFSTNNIFGILLALLCMALVLALNASLYRFFFRKWGLLFAIKGIFWHWFYFVYSSLAFATGIILALTEKSNFQEKPD